jgi:uncharacterized protein YdcH (DUF465 family)
MTTDAPKTLSQAAAEYRYHLAAMNANDAHLAALRDEVRTLEHTGLELTTAYRVARAELIDAAEQTTTEN